MHSLGESVVDETEEMIDKFGMRYIRDAKDEDKSDRPQDPRSALCG
jgi:hypothetical protein